VVEADNGDDAILLARQHRPQLALLDMRMHGKSGLDVAAYLRDYIGTPFIFLSAFGDESIVRQARDFGALEYLVKPVDVRRIIAAVEAALGLTTPAASSADADTDLPGTRTSPAATTESGGEDRIAVGILMERFRLTRRAAELRLEQLAAQRGREITAMAVELVAKFDAANAAPAPGHAPR
jgi:two-component system, response regulator PdtaR